MADQSFSTSMSTESQLNSYNPERTGRQPEIEARVMLVESRFQRIIHNKEIQKGTIALIRTLINAGISVADFFPGIGEAASWSADTLKSYKVKGLFRWLGLPDFDLTPSVSRAFAWGTEFAEVVTVGFVPSHFAESVLQFKREDLKHLKNAFLAMRKILKDEDELKVTNIRELDEAIKRFN